jgi:phytoene synthase
MPADLDASYRHCQRLARRAASSFYLAFWLLPRAKRRAMCALYAFLRRTDDLVDRIAPLAARRDALAAWRDSLRRALTGVYDEPMWPAVHDTVRRYAIPHDYLWSAIEGVEMDLDRRAYGTFAELESYLDRVASVVGLACLHIWGADLPAAVEPARRCGHAYQLTNILRDLHNDLAAGRSYLPQEDLDRFGCSLDLLRSGQPHPCVAELVRFEVARARKLYQHADRLRPLLSPDGRRVFSAMTLTYRALLDRVERSGPELLRRRPALPKWRKLLAVGQGWCSP